MKKSVQPVIFTGGLALTKKHKSKVRRIIPWEDETKNTKKTYTNKFTTDSHPCWRSEKANNKPKEMGRTEIKSLVLAHTKFTTSMRNTLLPGYGSITLSCTTLKSARQYVGEWLQSRIDQVDSKGRHLSAYTIATEAAAMGKLFGIRPDDPDRVKPPVRHREDIFRSRIASTKDKHFSVTNNYELIAFARGTGLRREGLQKLKGQDLWDRNRILEKITQIENTSSSDRVPEDRRMLEICKETEIYDKSITYFLYTKEKGGRERLAPIIGPDADRIVERVQRTPAGKRVWNYVNANADIHSYRADYCKDIYRIHERDLDSLPYDKVNRGTGHHYQSEVYFCRRDEKGRRLDRKAMIVCSKALGHNRIDIVAGNYLHGL